MMRCLLVAFLAASLMLLGCRDPCDPAEDAPRCEGDVAVTCPGAGPDQLGPSRWQREDCRAADGLVCVEANGGRAAFCALSRDPEPRCAERDSACESDTVELLCTAGFASARMECRACEEAEGGSLCFGGFGADCASSVDCAEGFVCETNPSCADCTRLACRE